MVHNKLATIDNLNKKCMIIPNRCYLCKEHEESQNHIFLHYSFVTMVWNEIRRNIYNLGALLESVIDWIEQWSPIQNNKHIEKAWYFILAHTL